MNVRELYTPGVAAVPSTHTLVQAAQAMVLGGVGALVVTNAGGEEIGIITETDVVQAVALGADTGVRRVTEHMSTELKSVDLDDDVRNAADRMRAGHFRHLLVTKDGRIIGILSLRDIAALVTGTAGLDG